MMCAFRSNILFHFITYFVLHLFNSICCTSTWSDVCLASSVESWMIYLWSLHSAHIYVESMEIIIIKKQESDRRRVPTQVMTIKMFPSKSDPKGNGSTWSDTYSSTVLKYFPTSKQRKSIVAFINHDKFPRHVCNLYMKFYFQYICCLSPCYKMCKG